MELFLLARKARVCALVTCAVLAGGCQNAVHSPIAPSLTSGSTPTESPNSVVMPGDEYATQGAPVSYPIDEVIANGSPSGYSGTCTVSNTHTGDLRVKVDGRGVAGSLVEFNVVNLSSPLQLRTVEYVDVNQQGTFRSNWQSSAGLFTTGDDVQCWLTSSVNGSTLASSTTFPAP